MTPKAMPLVLLAASLAFQLEAQVADASPTTLRRRGVTSHCY